MTRSVSWDRGFSVARREHPARPRPHHRPAADRTRQHPRPGHHGLDGGHHDRVLRLLRLRDRRLAGVPSPVLPHADPGEPAAELLRRLRCRVHRPPARLADLRPLRGPGGSQDHPRGEPAGDGHRDLPHRRAAHRLHARLRVHRPRDPGAAALLPGHRTGRRVVRRRPAGHRERSSRQARPVRHLPPARGPARLHPLQPAVRAAERAAHPGAVHGLGLARPLPALRGAGDRGAVGAPEAHGVPGLPEGARRGARRGRADRARSAPRGSRWCSRPSRWSRPTSFSIS